jgi:hypothetical protein
MIDFQRTSTCVSLAIGLAVLSALLPAVVSAAPRVRIQCDSLFESQPEPKVAKARKKSTSIAPDTSTAKPKTRALVSRKRDELFVEPEFEMHIKERIVLEGALDHYVGSHRIPLEYASGVDSKPKSDLGEFVAVSFITDVAPSLQASDSLRLGHAGAGRGQIGYSQPQSRNAVSVAQARPTTVAEIQAKGLSPVEVLSNFIRHETASVNLDQKSFDYIVATMQKDPAYMGRALAYHESKTLRTEGQSVVNGRAVNLANTGSYRYFRFTPEGSSQEVIARVLDINHVIGADGGFNVLVEWMRPANEMDVRIRHIQSLKVSELKSMRPMPESIRRAIELEFNSSLTPNEFSAQKLAAKAGLRTFGFTEMSRRAGGSEKGADPYRRMSGISHVASRDAVIKRFGKVDDLLTTEEMNSPDKWRIFDVMARLNPKYVLQRFNGRGTDFVYMFVITEDGQLKVAPFVEKGMNYKPELLRFAHGRRIFAGGTFTVGLDNRLDVTLESHDYQDIQGPLSHMAFRTAGQENLNSFVAYVFALQAGRQLTNLASAFADVFYSNHRSFDDEKPDDIAKERYGHDSKFRFAGPEGAEGSEGYQSYGGFTTRNVFEEAKRDMFEAANRERLAALSRERAEQFKVISQWSDAEGPAQFDVWRANYNKAFGMNYSEMRKMELRGFFEHDLELQLRFEWAQYVLRTNSEMSFDQVKGAYRKLRTKFHPDHTGGSGGPETRVNFQTIQSAFEVFEKFYRTHNEGGSR